VTPLHSACTVGLCVAAAMQFVFVVALVCSARAALYTPRVREPQVLHALNATLPPTRWTHNSYRPLTVLTFRFDHWLHGLDVGAFRASNIAIHGLTAVCALLFLRRLLAALGTPRATCNTYALVATVLFALHPTHSELVVNIASRAEMLCGLVMLLCLTLATPTPGTAPASVTSLPRLLQRLGGALLVLVATLCKETGLVTPVLVLALGALAGVRAVLVSPRTDSSATNNTDSTIDSVNSTSSISSLSQPCMDAVGGHSRGAPMTNASDSGRGKPAVHLGSARMMLTAVVTEWWRPGLTLLLFQMALLALRVTVISSGCVHLAPADPMLLTNAVLQLAAILLAAILLAGLGWRPHLPEC
jgi:hypothetical protein